MVRTTTALVLAALLGFGAGPASAQTPPAPAAKPPAPAPTATPAAAPAGSDYRVGPQDVLNITVFGEPQLSGKFKVDNDGTFPFQYLGRVKADDLTVTEIEANLKKDLAEGYLKSPQVSVDIDSYHSQNVYVMGEVRSPNKISLPGNSTLADVLALAGSVTATAGHWVWIHHARPGVVLGGPTVMDDSAQADIKVNLNDIQSGKAASIRIEDGDTIYVPKAERIYVTGQVRTPGAFPYDEDMTIFTAISLAGGINDKGSNSRIKVRRVDKKTGKQIEVDAKPEDTLQPGDQVNVLARRL
jgi:polysaccharide export outer membrane protein